MLWAAECPHRVIHQHVSSIQMQVAWWKSFQFSVQRKVLEFDWMLACHFTGSALSKYRNIDLVSLFKLL